MKFESDTCTLRSLPIPKPYHSPFASTFHTFRSSIFRPPKIKHTYLFTIDAILLTYFQNTNTHISFRSISEPSTVPFSQNIFSNKLIQGILSFILHFHITIFSNQPSISLLLQFFNSLHFSLNKQQYFSNEYLYSCSGSFVLIHAGL